MYLILNHAGRIVDISEEARHVRRQENGVVIGCEQKDADAIYSANTDAFYPIEPTGYIGDGHVLAAVKKGPPEVVAGYYFYHNGEFYSTEQELEKLAQAKAMADAVPVASLVFVSLAEKGEFDDTTITEHAGQFPAWVYPVAYAAGAIVQQGGKLYRCLQAHTSQEDWAPGTAASLWKAVGNPAAEWPAWSQPIGAVDAYSLGAKVTHNKKRWTSTADNNVWEPGVYGWEEVSK